MNLILKIYAFFMSKLCRIISEGINGGFCYFMSLIFACLFRMVTFLLFWKNGRMKKKGGMMCGVGIFAGGKMLVGIFGK